MFHAAVVDAASVVVSGSEQSAMELIAVAVAAVQVIVAAAAVAVAMPVVIRMIAAAVVNTTAEYTVTVDSRVQD